MGEAHFARCMDEGGMGTQDGVTGSGYEGNTARTSIEDTQTTQLCPPSQVVSKKGDMRNTTPLPSQKYHHGHR